MNRANVPPFQEAAPRLLNPGPVTLTPAVRAALGRPDLCHREPEFADLQDAIRVRLGRVYPAAAASHAAVILTGSGTAAVEAMVGSLIPPDGRALVVANGVYGERMAAMLEAQGKACDVVRADWLAPMDLAGAAEALARPGAYSHVLAVHHETTTGRLNDMPALGALCRKAGVPLLLDAVSSFGGEPIDFEAWGVQACAATANKCLHGVPGISFVLADRHVLETGTSGATSVYLDLFRYYRDQERGTTPFTQSVQACFGLDAALLEFETQGGWEARHARFRHLTGRIRARLAELGVGTLLPPGESSAVLTSYRLPPGIGYAKLHDHLKEAGFVIYAGQGRFSDDIFRIAVMGDLSDEDVDRLEAALETLLRKCAWVADPSS
jgi:2-aminoethylphosphonate-pyruvate transaminase